MPESPLVRMVNASGDRLFPQEASPEGCASGECLPDAEPETDEPDAPPPLVEAVRPPATPAEAWRAAVDKVRATSPRHGASLAFGRLVSLKPGEVNIAYPREAGFHKTTISAPTGKALVEKALGEHFGRPTRLVVGEASLDAAAHVGPSIAEQDLQNRADHERSTDAKVRTHPAMRAVLKLLGGEIEHIQVLDRERPKPAEAETPDDGG